MSGPTFTIEQLQTLVIDLQSYLHAALETTRWQREQISDLRHRLELAKKAARKKSGPRK